MNRSYLLRLSFALTLILTAFAFSSARAKTTVPLKPVAEERKLAELVICLDTSNSMDGLIDAARRKLWDITNEMAKAKPTPRLRVALMSYGNDGYKSSEGWVRMESDFTEDLDAIYEKLFALKTNGGTEYVGRVLHASLEKLSWDSSKDGLKLIFVAGNESASQDTECRFQEESRRAIGRGIMVNSIYCGAASSGEAAEWRQVASLADGQFASIDQEHGIVEVATPYDKKLGELSSKLNTTYVPYGSSGLAGAANQMAQDSNASALAPTVAASRASMKGGAMYQNSWDLVDALKNKDVKLEAVKSDDLPSELKGKTLIEQKAYLASKTQERTEIQKEIGKISVEREGYIKAEMKKRGLKEDQSFDAAVRKAIRSQAEKKGLTFEK